MADCDDVREKLVEFAEQELRFMERLRIEVHLTRCPECSHEYAEYRAALEASGEVLQHPDPRYRFREVMARIDAEETACRRLWTPRMRYPWKNTIEWAVAMLVLALASLVAPKPWHGKESGEIKRMAGPIANYERELAKQYRICMNLESDRQVNEEVSPAEVESDSSKAETNAPTERQSHLIENGDDHALV